MPPFARPRLTMYAAPIIVTSVHAPMSFEHRIEVPVFERGEERLIRVSFQGYNDAADLERLKSALDVLLAE